LAVAVGSLDVRGFDELKNEWKTFLASLRFDMNHLESALEELVPMLM